METIVRKHMARILKYMVVQQLEWGRGGIVAFFFFNMFVSFSTSFVITAVLKTDA